MFEHFLGLKNNFPEFYQFLTSLWGLPKTLSCLTPGGRCIRCCLLLLLFVVACSRRKVLWPTPDLFVLSAPSKWPWMMLFMLSALMLPRFICTFASATVVLWTRVESLLAREESSSFSVRFAIRSTAWFSGTNSPPSLWCNVGTVPTSIVLQEW